MCIKSKPPLKGLSGAKIMSLINMVFMLDRPGFIHRALIDTQTRDRDKQWSTNTEQWRKFSKTYAEDTNHATLLVSFQALRISTVGY